MRINTFILSALTVTAALGAAGAHARASRFVSSGAAAAHPAAAPSLATPVKVETVTLSATELSLVPQESHTLVAATLPANADDGTVRWSSSRTTVATVTAAGVVNAVSEGSCTITATAKDGSGKTAKCLVTVAKRKPTAQSLVINEIMAANIDFYLDPSFNYGCWAELYNPADASVSLGGLYVSDDPANLKKHRLVENYGALQAGGFAILNFDHHEIYKRNSYRQIDDKLDCEGGTLILSDGTHIIARQDYPPAIGRTSYARTQDGGPTWGVTANPTPGASNNTAGGFASIQLEAPAVDKPAQVFENSLQTYVTIPHGATLRYTTDGTTPTMQNGKTSVTGFFNISQTTCFRFRLFQDGFLPSPVVTRSYIYKDRDFAFPIVSIVTDPAGIHSSAHGIFQQGSNGRPGRGQSANCNWNMEWDRPVALDYLDERGECVVSQECDIAMTGGWSRANTPHSLKLKANKVYDLNKFFQYQFFTNKPYLKNKTLLIRNGGNDAWSGRIKDAILQQIAIRSGIDLDCQEWEPVHVLINGAYYATLNLREPSDDRFAYANYGLDDDEVDQFEICADSGYVQKKGDNNAWLRLMELSAQADDPDTYTQITQLLDIDEFANYMAAELYLGNWDWPQNNVKAYREKTAGRFRFVVFDLDGAGNTGTPFSTLLGKENYTYDMLYGYDFSQNKSLSNTRITRKNDIAVLFKNMIRNEQFRKNLTDRFCIIGGSVYQPKLVSEIAADMASRMARGVYRDDNFNPRSSASEVTNKFGNANYNSSMANQLKAATGMNLTTKNRQAGTFNTNTPGAKILFNGIELPHAEFNGHFFQPLTLKAEAPAGHRFVGWHAAANDATVNTVFDTHSTWKVYDTGSLDDKRWHVSTFSDTHWTAATAPLGYGKNQTKPTASGKLCYYFRKTFQLANTPAPGDIFTLDFTLDDGAIIYINGTEAYRTNMPDGNVTYNTPATTYAPGNPDTGTVTLPARLFKRGANLIAVEVHNNSTTSTDIVWDARLTTTDLSSYSEEQIVSTDPQYTVPATGTQKLTAIFKPIPADELEETQRRPVRVNEVSAANSMHLNDHFKKNDWIELYNTTDHDIDLAGMHISDNARKPQKYQIPTDHPTLNTIIPARGYKVIWCDNLTTLGEQIHTTFKLDADGGDVLITTPEYADTLTYPPHLGTQTFGRYPDGADATYTMNRPTIAKANALTSTDHLFVKDSDNPPTGIRTLHMGENPARHSEGGVTIDLRGQTLRVRSDDSPVATLTITSASGITTLVRTDDNRSHQHTISTAALPRGLHIVRVITQDGDETHTTILLR